MHAAYCASKAGIHGMIRAMAVDLAVYLASDKASFLTGETVVLDGGRTARLPSPS
ncbi:NAD(P)-dependent dehydrogenase (short-subunit alcohol dehydrogenase family) [Saccharopolyspora lacisalsi]|uniref:NAD(P)-dependent dehydrogenase (Short-subunit alcohol dehydrogenase family) n=1 Tax=Halosaccharopolyspora lacisalsi TaxID=1000566 RepID=A0A839DXQ2_9PSEU|nr:NAD(P)-dependent dehydrogenase (short-subunit alcohol dehydrogenase family) [Halosaccharopolyspora lacisalsi]